MQVHFQGDGSKWFELAKTSIGELENTVDAIQWAANLSNLVESAKSSSRDERLARLRSAPKKPRKVAVLSQAFVRNADVIAEVLFRADGVCEGCHHPAPFTRTSDATPYLEVHHKIHLANGGEDVVENAVALCANCHRQEHSGLAKWPN